MATKTRKLPKRPERRVGLLKPAVADTIGESYVLRVLVGDELSYYEVSPSEFGPHWNVLKVGSDIDATLSQPIYRTTIDPEMGNSCTCPAGKYRGTCKHQDFLSALVAAKRLPDLCKRQQTCPECHGHGGPAAGDRDSDGAACRSCGE